MKKLSKLLAASLLFSPSVFADIYNTRIDNISPTLFKGGNATGINVGNIGLVNAEFNFSINFYGLANAQVQEIKNHVTDTAIEQTAREQMTSLIGELDEVTYNINSYVAYSGSSSDPAGMLFNLSKSTNKLLTHNAFIPKEDIEHRHLTGHYAVAVGFKVSELEEAAKGQHMPKNQVVLQLRELKTNLENRIAETDTWVESMVNITSHRVSCGGGILRSVDSTKSAGNIESSRSLCTEFSVKNSLTNQVEWFRYNLYGNEGYQSAKATEAFWEKEAKELFKGSRLEEAMGYLEENIEYLSK